MEFEGWNIVKEYAVSFKYLIVESKNVMGKLMSSLLLMCIFL